jgi:hypothetical protein
VRRGKYLNRNPKTVGQRQFGVWKAECEIYITGSEGLRIRNSQDAGKETGQG